MDMLKQKVSLSFPFSLKRIHDSFLLKSETIARFVWTPCCRELPNERQQREVPAVDDAVGN